MKRAKVNNPTPLQDYPSFDKRIIINTDILLYLYLNKKRCDNNAIRNYLSGSKLKTLFWEQASKNQKREINRLEKYMNKIKP